MADTTRNRAAPPPQVQITMVEKAIVIALLLLGLVLLYTLASKMFLSGPRPQPSPKPVTSPSASAAPAVVASATPAPSASPAAGLPTIDAIRAHFREDQPFTAIKEVTQVLEAETDAVTKDQSLVELEQNMERMDRTLLYQVIDEYHKKATSSRQKAVDKYLGALVASKTFLFERHNPRKALQELEQLASDKASPLAPLAVNKMGMLLVSQNPTEAIAAFSRQIREFPDFPLNGFASLMIGTCYRALEQDQRALSQYQETLEKYRTAYGEGGLPLEPFVRHALADTMLKLGDKDNARKELNLIVSQFKEYPYLGIIQETLQSLPPAGGKG
jgi:tetratricopeptide (TPR) repeat protein